MLLNQWREQKILVQDSTPSYYLYQQIFKIEQKSHSRTTLMAAVKLSDFDEGHVLPHENTHGVYREDRLNILRKTQTNLSL